jgi:MFS family permease
VRLFIAILWLLSSVMWLPWFALLIRLLVDVAMGASFTGSDYFVPTLMGPWPLRGWLAPWQVVSWYPVSAVTAMALTAFGWRLYWREQDFRLTRPVGLVVFSILVPPIAPLLLLGDVKRRFRIVNSELDGEVEDARQRIRYG